MRIEAFCYQKLFLRRKKRERWERKKTYKTETVGGRWGGGRRRRKSLPFANGTEIRCARGGREEEGAASRKTGRFQQKKSVYIPTIIDKTELPATRSEREEGEKNQKVNNKIENLWFFSFVGCLKGIFFFNFSVLAELRKKSAEVPSYSAHSIVQQRRKRRNDY